MFHKLLLEQGVVARADMTFPWNADQIHRFIIGNSYPWDPNQLAGVPHVTDPAGLVPYALTLLALASFLPTTLAGVAWLIMWTFASGVSLYFLCHHLGSKNGPAFISALFYMSSTYIGNAILAGDRAAIMSYAIMPFGIFSLLRMLESDSKKYVVLTGSLSGLLITFTLTQAALFLVSMVAIGAIFTALHFRHHGTFRKTLLKLGEVFLLAFGLNGFWILPYLVNSVTTRTLNWYLPPLAYFIQLYSGSTNALYSLIGNSTGEYREVFFSYSAQSMYLIGLIILSLIAFASLLVKPRDWKILAFASLFAVDFVPANGVNPPTGQVFGWLFTNVPLFVLFDRPYFSSSIIALCLAVLLNYSVSTFVRLRITSLGRKGLSLLRYRIAVVITTGIKWAARKRLLFLYLVITLIVLQNSWPMFTGDFAGRISRFEFPQEYQALDNWLSSQGSGFRVLMLPPYTAGQWNWFPNYGDNIPSRYPPFNNPLVEYSPQPTVTLGWGVNYNKLSSFIINSIYLDRSINAAKLLGLLGVKYVVVSLDQLDVSQWSSRYAPYQNTSMVFHDILPHMTGLKPVWQMGSIHAFENDFYLPLFLNSSNYALVAGDFGVLESLIALDSFNISNLPFLFVDQLDHSNLQQLSRNASLILFQDNQWLDFLLSLTNGTVWIDPSTSTTKSPSYHSEWASSNIIYNFGWWDQPFYLEGPFRDPAPWSFADGQNVTSPVSFTVNKGGTYGIWARTYDGLITGPHEYPYNAQRMDLKIDGEMLASISNSTPVLGGFNWKHVGDISLKSGSHVLNLVNESGFDFLSKLALVPEGELEATRAAITQFLERSPISQAYLLDWARVSRDSIYDAIPFISYVSNRGWVVTGDPSNPPSPAITNWMTTFKRADSITLHLNVEKDRGYFLYVTGLTGNNKGVLNYSLDNGPATQLDWYENTTQNSWKTLLVGNYNLSQGVHTLVITNSGTANSSSRAGRDSLEGIYPDDQAALYAEPQAGVPIFVVDNESATGMAVSSLTDGLTTAFSVSVAKAGNYSVAVRLKALNKSPVTIEVDSSSQTFNSDGSGNYNNYLLGPYNLTEGSHQVRAVVQSATHMTLDQLTLVSQGQSRLAGLLDVLKSLSTAYDLPYKMVSPTDYELSPSDTFKGTGLITFLESFHSGWVAKGEGETVTPIVVDGFANGFFLKEQAGQKFDVVFTPSSYQLPGLGISILTIVASLLFLLLPQVKTFTRRLLNTQLRRSRGRCPTNPHSWNHSCRINGPILKRAVCGSFASEESRLSSNEAPFTEVQRGSRA
jgi:hypothetical protein